MLNGELHWVIDPDDDSHKIRVLPGDMLTYMHYPHTVMLFVADHVSLMLDIELNSMKTLVYTRDMGCTHRPSTFTRPEE